MPHACICRRLSINRVRFDAVPGDVQRNTGWHGGQRRERSGAGSSRGLPGGRAESTKRSWAFRCCSHPALAQPEQSSFSSSSAIGIAGKCSSMAPISVLRSTNGSRNSGDFWLRAFQSVHFGGHRASNQCPVRIRQRIAMVGSNRPRGTMISTSSDQIVSPLASSRWWYSTPGSIQIE